jgi:alkylation response protein AidB-like acyl-CoA dehydrogenase
MMADAEMELNAARLLIYRAACNARELPNNVRLPIMDEASMAKAYTGHAALEVVSESLQMFGAAGYPRPAPGADVPRCAHVPDRRRNHPGTEKHDRTVDFQEEIQPAKIGQEPTIGGTP